MLSLISTKLISSLSILAHQRRAALVDFGRVSKSTFVEIKALVPCKFIITCFLLLTLKSSAFFWFQSETQNDAAYPWQIGFQDGSTPSFEGIVELHDSIFFYLIVISFLVFWMMGSVLLHFNSNRAQIVHKYHNHGTLIELVWTITPALLLIAIAFPSFKLLYLMDEVISPSMTIKVAGHQWYWSYEYSDFINEDGESIEFDSYMVPESDLELGQFRLLDVDNRVVVPVDTHVRFIVTGQDVIHDFAVPSLGLKIDAVPGRLNQTSVLIQREGVYYGQCSEICGVYHGFMPIAVEAVSLEKYLSWLDSQV